jgi:tRNA/rRNA methyltransferase
VNLGHVAVVLQKPRYPENIGSAARAMRNMGLGRLRVVAPENFDLSKVRALATHAAADVVDRIELFEDLGTALAPFQYVVGTTARTGGQRRVIDSPARLARELIAISRENQVALVFGPEDRGLTNEDIRLCHSLVTIPTADFSSLNLAQAVMVLCYELARAGRPQGGGFSPRMATRHELDGMFDQLREILVRISFINAENPDYWLNNLRRFFTRLQLRAGEVAIIRGLCRQVDWYAEKRYRDGLETARGAAGVPPEPGCRPSNGKTSP